MSLEFQNILTDIIQFILIIFTVYYISRIFKLYHNYWTFDRPKQAGLYGLLGIALTFALMSILILALAGQQEYGDQEISYGPGRVFSQLILCLLMAAPILYIIRHRKESWRSVGVTGRNWPGSLLVGILLSILPIVSTPGATTALKGFNAVCFWALVNYTFTGFSEEFIFRGYLQTRLMTWLGKWIGMIIASLIMASSHIMIRYLWQDYTFSGALLSSAELIPASLIMGYIMMRTGSIIAPGILHTIGNFSGVLGQMNG